MDGDIPDGAVIGQTKNANDDTPIVESWTKTSSTTYEGTLVDNVHDNEQVKTDIIQNRNTTIELPGTVNPEEEPEQ